MSEIYSELKSAVIFGAVSEMDKFIAKEERIKQNEIQAGLKLEELISRGEFKSPERHTKGAKAAWKAQKF